MLFWRDQTARCCGDAPTYICIRVFWLGLRCRFNLGDERYDQTVPFVARELFQMLNWFGGVVGAAARGTIFSERMCTSSGGAVSVIGAFLQ